MYWLLTFVLLPQNMAAEGCAFGGRCECSSPQRLGTWKWCVTNAQGTRGHMTHLD